MNSPYRRYEILLPSRFNNGQSVPDRLLVDAIVDLRNQFGAVSVEPQTIQGQWQYQGETYRDELIRVFVDVDDTLANRQFFTEFKEELKLRFNQLDVWITSHPVDVI